MSRKTPKPARDRRPAPYAPSTFEAPETLKANIRSITKYLTEQILGMGMGVIVRQSRIPKSQSRYLEVDSGRRRYTIRISDHALRHGKKHDFYIYTHTPYEKSLHYMAFIAKFRKIAGEG